MAIPSSFRQTGVALLAALILILALVYILGSIFYRHQIDISQSSQALHRDQAQLLALSGENWARQLLDDDKATVDHFGELWAQAIPAMPVDGGMINGCISDLQGRFNLNSFKGYTANRLSTELASKNASFPLVWDRLLGQLEIAQFPGRVEAIIDWIDDDSALVGSSGAEQDDYGRMMPPRMAGNQEMVEPSELATVMGYQIFEVQALMPWLAALPEATPININTASDELLLALGADQDTLFRDLVLENRPFDELQDFYTDLLDLGMSMSEVKRRWPSTLVDIKSQYFQLYIEVLLGEARIEVKSIIKRPTTGKPVILSRELTTVPASLPKDSAGDLKKLAGGTDTGTDSNPDDPADDTEVQPACLMIEA